MMPNRGGQQFKLAAGKASENRARPFARTVRIAEDDAVGAEARGGRCGLADLRFGEQRSPWQPRGWRLDTDLARAVPKIGLKA